MPKEADGPPNLSEAETPFLSELLKRLFAGRHPSLGDLSPPAVPWSYAGIELLVLDELGYVQASETDAKLHFHVLAERNEVASIVLTTNLPFGEWTRIFTDPRLCKAVVDRLTFGAHIIETGTDSWRLPRSLDRARKDSKT